MRFPSCEILLSALSAASVLLLNSSQSRKTSERSVQTLFCTEANGASPYGDDRAVGAACLRPCENVSVALNVLAYSRKFNSCCSFMLCSHYLHAQTQNVCKHVLVTPQISQQNRYGLLTISACSLRSCSHPLLAYASNEICARPQRPQNDGAFPSKPWVLVVCG